MPREILLNAFAMSTVGHVSPGLWTHPRDRSSEYHRLSTWTGLAEMLERGMFDGLFLADVLGVYDVHRGGNEGALRHAVQLPINDPLLLVSAMAHVTRHLGFGVTANLSWETPYQLARRFSTLDHLTDGRIGWNIVTGYLASAARAMGAEMAAHDERYDLAEDFMALAYKFWDGSWEDGAVLRDRASRVFADPARVHTIRHAGSHFRAEGIHLCEPSPQRTPLLYQAGTSRAGRAFAGRHAECVFVSGPSVAVIAPRVAALREAAMAAGRAADDLKVLSALTVIVAETTAEAHALEAEYRRHASGEGALVLMSGWTGLDFGAYDADQEVRHIESEAMRTALENVTARGDPTRRWTVREVAEFVAIGGVAPVLVGSAAEVADAVEDWVDRTGVDGLNLSSVVFPETFERIAALLVPELQRRGRVKRAHRPGTLREKLFGRPRVAETHPAAGYRVGRG